MVKAGYNTFGFFENLERKYFGLLDALTTSSREEEKKHPRLNQPGRIHCVATCSVMGSGPTMLAPCG